MYQNTDLMVASDLQSELVEEITEILKDVSSVNDSGEPVEGFTGYEQFLPVLKNDDDDPDQFFPYFIVRLDSAKTEDDGDLWTATVDILLGVHDEDTENNGHKVILNAITRITTRFSQDAVLARNRNIAFRCLPEMEWGLQDEDTYPYFFGGIQLKFWMPKPERKEPDYGY